MKINKANAIKFWEENYGTKSSEYDFAGRIMTKDSYDNRNNHNSWNIDHIMPISKGGSGEKHNLMCVNIITNDEKGDKISFVANGEAYQVRKKSGSKTYEIVKINNNEEETTNESSWNKKDFALNKWQENFDSDNEKDFAKRIIKKEEFLNKKSEFGWEIIALNSSAEISENNYAIVNLKTSAEKNSRNSFTSNGFKFQIQKKENGYEVVGKNTIVDEYSLNSLKSFINNYVDDDKKIFMNYVIIKSNNSETIKLLIALIETLKDNLPKIENILRYEEIIELRFETNSKSEVSKIMDFAILIYTYKKYFIEALSMNFTIANCLFSIEKQNKYNTTINNEEIENLLNICRYYDYDEMVVNDLVLSNCHEKYKGKEIQNGFKSINYTYTDLKAEIESETN